MNFSRICVQGGITALSCLTTILISSCDSVSYTPTPNPLYPYPHGIIPADGLTFDIALDKTIYSVGQPISVTRILVNTGSIPGWVNKHLTLVNSDSQEGETITITVKNAAGEEMPFVTRMEFGPEKVPGDFVILTPHEFAGETFEISAHYLLGPGKYSVQVIYENTLDLDNGMATWKGKLESEAVAFLVEP